MKKILLSAAALMTLAACQTTEVATKPASKVLAPAELNAMEFGEVRKYKRIRDGEEMVSTAKFVEGDIIEWSNSDGCHGTSIAGDRFAPALSWNKCGDNANWHTGTSSISSKSDSLWPLQVGKTATYSYSSKSHTGRTGSNTRNCEVESTVSVTAAGKDYDAYKVVCSDRNNIRTYFYSPEATTVVYQTTYNKRRNSTETTELVERIQ